MARNKYGGVNDMPAGWLANKENMGGKEWNLGTLIQARLHSLLTKH